MKKLIALLLALMLLPLPVMAEESEESCLSLIEKVNDYYIAVHPNPPGYSWDEAAYYVGCMEAYYATGIEAYREYAEKWAEKNSWSGSREQDHSLWNNSNVYHADNQTIFQTCIDLYNLEPEDRKIARALEVTNAQMNAGRDSFWTWCDALFMSMPVYTKLYLVTEDSSYLDALYRFFKYAKETMYDGEGGIAYEGEPVNLFFRDPGYIKSKIDGEKNIWARGTGWVMAAFAKVFSDVPENWEHYDYFKKTYLEMAASCKKYAKSDLFGNMYYTQSVIPFYPVSDQNPRGYETSGTAFICYSILWGINSGMLSREEYAPLAEGLLSYVKNAAIQSDGMVGYSQPIGAAATSATTAKSTNNFGTGAVLLALAEGARYEGEHQDDLYPYLTKKCLDSVSFKIGAPYACDGKSVTALEAAPFIEDGRTYVPKSACGLFDSVSAETKSVGGIDYVQLRAAASENIYWNDAEKIVTVGMRQKPFYDCDGELVVLLSEILQTGSLPSREPQGERVFKISTPEFDDPSRLDFASVYSEDIPQPENSPENACDLSLGSRWSAEGASPTIEFDLGEVKYVEKIALAFWQNDARSTLFDLYTSSDGENYTSVFSGGSTVGETFDYVSVKSNIRYIKLVGHGNTSNTWTSLLETVAYGA